MAFKIRDLMITDLTGSSGTHLRLAHTGARCTTRDCIIRATTCGYGVGLGTDPAQIFEQLALLKAQLTEELAEVEKEQAALEAHLAPGSLAEVEALELKLAAASEELTKLKEDLKQKPA